MFINIRLGKETLWQMNYRFVGKRKTLSFGPYPLISLQKARSQREAARIMLNDGIDPMAVKQARREAVRANDGNSYEVVTREGGTDIKRHGRNPTANGQLGLRSGMFFLCLELNR
jgi:hypothetical protein